MEDKQFACIVYKALLQWRSFEAEKTNIFDRIIHTIYSSIEVVFLCHFTFDYLVTSYANPHKRLIQFEM